MNKSLGITGWGIAVIAVIGVGCYARYADKLSTELEEARAKLETTELKLGVVRQQLKRVADAKSPASQDVKTLETSLATANEELAQLKVTSELTALAASAFADAKRDDAEKSEKPGNPMLKMMAEMGENEELMAAQTKMMVNMQYSSLFRDLALPADVATQMKDILAEASREQMKAGMEMASGKESMSGQEMKNLKESGTDWARTELSKILTADEMAAWEDFEANKEQHMLEQSYDMQLGMFAAGLTDENKTMVRDVMVEEAMLLQESALDRDGAFDMAGQMELQMSIFENARERIFPALDEDQYAIADSFFEQQESMIRMSMEMMRGMFEQEEGENADNAPPTEVAAEPVDSAALENE